MVAEEPRLVTRLTHYDAAFILLASNLSLKTPLIFRRTEMFCPSCGKELPDGSAFCLHCGKPTAAPTQAAQKKAGHPILRIIVIGSLLLILVGLLLSKFSTSTNNELAKQAASTHMSSTLFTGQTVVKANGYVTKKFTVEPGMQDFHVVGQFNASGGAGNDIQVVLTDEDEFQNWVNGHEAKVFYSTKQITTGKLDVGPLEPGRYVLAFSNTFSAFTDKYVFAEIEARWTVQQ
jgi:hypothetical protein